MEEEQRRDAAARDAKRKAAFQERTDRMQREKAEVAKSLQELEEEQQQVRPSLAWLATLTRWGLGALGAVTDFCFRLAAGSGEGGSVWLRGKDGGRRM